MGLFSRKIDPSKPRRGWPWRLTLGPAAPRQAFSYGEVEQALRAMVPDGDSFVILEQRDPKDARRYWYLQSALALTGGERGRYVLCCGYVREDGSPALMERYTPEVQEVLSDFRLSYRGQGPDLSLYVDCSSQLPANQQNPGKGKK